MKACGACRAILQPASVPTAGGAQQRFHQSLRPHHLQSTSPETDTLGRSIPLGTVLDPATTRPVTAGTVDPVSGLASATTPAMFAIRSALCAPATTTFTLAACGLNQLPAGRLDPNAVKLLNLYPAANQRGVHFELCIEPQSLRARNAFDIRVDFNPSAKGPDILPLQLCG